MRMPDKRVKDTDITGNDSRERDCLFPVNGLFVTSENEEERQEEEEEEKRKSRYTIVYPLL